MAQVYHPKKMIHHDTDASSSDFSSSIQRGTSLSLSNIEYVGAFVGAVDGALEAVGAYVSLTPVGAGEGAEEGGRVRSTCRPKPGNGLFEVVTVRLLQGVSAYPEEGLSKP